MRKGILLAAAAAAALFAGLLTAPAASADGETVVTIGPGQYSGSFEHPTGTISVGGGTISARCVASSAKGSPVFETPSCVTKKITCPATAAYCSMVLNFRENALRGPVVVGAAFSYVGTVAFVGNIQAYNCPQAFSCGAKELYAISPGTTLQSAVFNFSSPNYPNIFNQVSLTVH